MLTVYTKLVQLRFIWSAEAVDAVNEVLELLNKDAESKEEQEKVQVYKNRFAVQVATVTAAGPEYYAAADIRVLNDERSKIGLRPLSPEILKTFRTGSTCACRLVALAAPCTLVTPCTYPCRDELSEISPVIGAPVNCKFICTVARRDAGVCPARTLAASAISTNTAIEL